jgi:hypothetical protein
MNYSVILFSYTSEILEIQADAPSLHILFVPGNPGMVLICFSVQLYLFSYVVIKSRFQDLLLKL